MRSNKEIDQENLLNTYQEFINANNELGGKVIIDVSTTILLANDLNLPFSLELGQRLIVLPALANLDLSSKMLTSTIASTNSSKQVFQFTENNKRSYWYQLIITPILKTESPLFFVQFLDITVFKELELQLAKHRDRVENEMLLRTQEIAQTDLVMKDQGGFLLNFLRGLRHDLTSPITQLKDIIEYYKKTVDPHKKERSAMLIDDCLLKLTNTAKGFSNFVDIHLLANNEIEEINMMEIFEETKQVLASEINDAVVQINCDFRQANMVYFNKKLISSILYNLLSNALKFRKQSNQLVISITSYIEAGYFQLKIVDNGIGIDLDKHRDHLFVPFKRFTMDRPGAGIALSMIKNILNRYEGDIIIESEANVGTTVFVKIPINNKPLFKRQ